MVGIIPILEHVSYQQFSKKGNTPHHSYDGGVENYFDAPLPGDRQMALSVGAVGDKGSREGQPRRIAIWDVAGVGALDHDAHACQHDCRG